MNCQATPDFPERLACNSQDARTQSTWIRQRFKLLSIGASQSIEIARFRRFWKHGGYVVAHSRTPESSRAAKRFGLNELSGAHPVPGPKAQRACNGEPDCHNGHGHAPAGGLAGEGQGLFPCSVLDLLRNQTKDQGQAERDDDQIIEVAKDWDEVRNKVDWAEGVRRDQQRQPAGEPWSARITSREINNESVLPKVFRPSP